MVENYRVFTVYSLSNWQSSHCCFVLKDKYK
jgi:hypothetical protein